ncbi:iron ABC transporter permease [Gracilibacillus caseinilyticus]|uniref:Iron ABC transporter permease n=1 Tax=Gracilibacillus caseinilyticus TaxID=2932256 RepID=A0ABY4EZW3_9BACI|nr:iron ABC transporter permease [Gracilibacillus caseinilyticus]UOQ49943.1 iron ABC transporter permease [Gracilibacillus caseinilyticus]
MISKTKRTSFWLLGLTIGLIATILLSLNLGTMSVSPIDVWKTMIGQGTDQNQLVLFDFRLPRIVIALLIGAGMAISGAILQGVTHNDLADPGILGINSGAGFAVVLFIYLTQNNLTSTVFILPLAALGGAVLAAALIYLISWKNGVSPIRLILVGIGINAAFSALIIVFQLKMDPDDFTKAQIWLTGNIAGTDWSYTLALLPWILILLPIAFFKAGTLDALHLGDETAQGLGTNVEKERIFLLVIAVALAGASVAVGGAIAFLGLVIPHLARKLVGARHHHMLITSALLGALLLLVADTIGRNILSPSEIPVGIIVSLIGGSYFVYLLMKS